MNVSIPIEGTDRQVAFQIRKCDITLQDAEALVAFRVQNGLSAGKSFTVLHAANVEEEYQDVKSQNGHVDGVVKTGLGNLTSHNRKCILHIEVTADLAGLKNSILAALRQAEISQIKSVAFAPLIYLKDSATAKKMARTLVEGMTNFIQSDKPVCLKSVLICDHRVKFVQFQGRDPGNQKSELSLLQVASVTYKKRDPHFRDVAKKVLCDNCITATLMEHLEEENNNNQQVSSGSSEGETNDTTSCT